MISFVLCFILPYTIINQISQARATQVLAFSLDSFFPFSPVWIFVYLSSFILVFVPYFCIRDIKNFRRTIVASFFILCISYCLFLLYPVHMIRPVFEVNNFSTLLTHFFYKIDAPYNTFPSLHVSLSFITALGCFFDQKKYAWMLVWATGIAFSTLFVKQHYVADVFSWLFLAFLSYRMYIAFPLYKAEEPIFSPIQKK